jgi:hypothetical protein
MRQVLLVVMAMGLMSAGEAAPQPIATPAIAANQRAYDVTLVCYVVAVDGKNESDHARALDGVRKMAKALGYNSKRMSDDISKMVAVLGAKARSDPSAITRNREGCRKLGLIS